MDWGGVIDSVVYGGAAGAVGAAVLGLAHLAVKERLKRAIDHEYKLKEAEFGRVVQEGLERVLAEQTRLTEEHKVRFSRFDTDRSEAIKQLFVLSVGLRVELRNYINNTQHSNPNAKPVIYRRDALEYALDVNEILVPEYIVRLIRVIVESSVWRAFSVNGEFPDDGFDKNLTALHAALRDEFRRILSC